MKVVTMEKTEDLEIDIDDIRNYRTEEGSRRQIKHSKLTPSGDRYVKLLCRLLEKNGVGDLTNNEKSAIEGVLAALWDSLRTNQIAEESQKIIWNWKNKERKCGFIYFNILRNNCGKM